MPPCTTLPIPSEDIKHLLVRAPNWIGDAVMCTSAFMMLREMFPLARMTVLARPTVAELLQGHPAFDALIVYDHQGSHAGLGGRWGLIRQLKTLAPDMAVLFQNAFEAALLMWLAGIPIRCGYATDGRGWLLSHPIPVPDWKDQRHHVEYFRQIARALGCQAKEGPPMLTVSEGVEREWVDLTRLGIEDSMVLIGMNPGSVYGGAKRWLPDRFAAAADQLVLTIQERLEASRVVRCVIVGGPDETGLGQAIGSLMQTRPLVLSGRTTLRELLAVIQRCRCLITNDTGPMHMADALGVPVVAVFGSTNPVTTSPFGPQHTVVRHPVRCGPCLLRSCPIDHRCMAGIHVESVVQAAIHHLDPLFPKERTSR